nr:sugar-binding protein [Calditrichia bacterium]
AAYPGFGFEMPVKNLSLRWMTDSLKFKIKAPSGVGTLRVEFEDAFGTKIKEEIPEPGSGYNDTWMDMAIPLRDIDTYQAGSDFDTTQVKFMIMLAEGTGNGSTILFDDMWTGNPDIDVIPPSAPTSLFVVPDNQNNVVTWVDSPNETGETYTIYYSRNPIVATLEGTKYRGVEVVDRGFNLSEGSGQYPHLLLSPVADSTTNYYYAVTATDAAGNESNPVVSATPVSNTSRGVTTVSLVAPTNFVADGNAGDWGSRTAFRVALSAGARVATNTTVDNDADLSMDAYLAIDSDYLYFFLDIEDDVVDTTAGNTWEKDSPDLFIGLYDFHGMPHSGGLQRGGEPDYQFRFLPSKAIIDNIGAATAVSASSGDYFWAETFPTGYVIEGRVALADLATIGNDTPFSPSEGVRIPFDFALNDADAGNGTREGIMAWSPYNDDSGYQSPSYWLYNWIGNRENILAIEDVDPIVADRFVLEQNYPNPFNPTTTIVYNLAKQSSVKLSVFNSLGQKVAELVDENQSAGRYTVKLDGSSLASGIYFYQLQAGSFSQVRKMILLK